MDSRKALEEGIHELGRPIESLQIDQLIQYLDLLKKWNRTYNLVSSCGARDLVHKHLLDSLAIAPFITCSPVLDVGSGAGLPGVPLAITLPELTFTLLDANGKKTRFLRQVVIELGLTNVQVIQIRVENYQFNDAPCSVISRAFAPVETALSTLLGVCAPHGQVLIMLGESLHIEPLRQQVSDICMHTLQIPGLSDQRHLLVATKA